MTIVSYVEQEAPIKTKDWTMSSNHKIYTKKRVIDKWDMNFHKNSGEECIGTEQVSHQKYCYTNYDVIKYLYSVNVIQYLFRSNYKFRVRPKLLSINTN